MEEKKEKKKSRERVKEYSLKVLPTKERINKIFLLFLREYGSVATSLKYAKDWQLLFSVILSAQNTDANVNKVTSHLYKKYPNLSDYVDIDLGVLEKEIYSTGYYKSKARYIKETANILLDKHNGKVPDSMEELLELPGVGRKTANVVLGVLFGKSEGVVVDTHVARVSYRLGLSSNRNNPTVIERELNSMVPKKNWEDFSLYLISHGRKYCKAINPECKHCVLRDLCPRVGVD